MTIREWSEAKPVASVHDRWGNKLEKGSVVNILARDLFDSSRSPLPIEMSAPSEPMRVTQLLLSSAGAFYVDCRPAHSQEGGRGRTVLAHNVTLSEVE